ncbi:oxidoreductase, short-chain dehydrogenase/reductase family [Pochonia chlamydosporia 170]|uniref:Oxidoreductase, short-chain dehydrogenase/reductase family n=1 Tax=Pochonia chlamydosporia 170 TaxID=1380566 RepID=A0A179G0F5_METCM|nr:oxidoreductase, short-chain dehydrogenase/reductase family [Pochonia chlamydosporia 170]OAQ71386.1 oxidoreductase, short-chain dehydrogenase/reductase family [Pochonia chlamydosporia 170]
MSKKTIFITGCSADSLGASIAIELAKQQHFVYVTARNLSKIPTSLASLANVAVLKLDISSPDSIAEAVKTVKEVNERNGLTGIDVLINSAARAYTMPIQDMDIDEARRLFDTNVWGTLRLIQHLSPMIIPKKGRIVNISSVGAVVNTPWQSTYSASKAALTRYSEILRHELAPFGVSVVTVMLGTVATQFKTNEPIPDIQPTSRYFPILDTITNWANGSAGPQGGPVHDVVESLLPYIIEDGRGGLAWIGHYSTIIRVLSHWGPAWILDKMVTQDQGLVELKAVESAKDK